VKNAKTAVALLVALVLTGCMEFINPDHLPSCTYLASVDSLTQKGDTLQFWVTLDTSYNRQFCDTSKTIIRGAAQ
jgi:hypothetical protein